MKNLNYFNEELAQSYWMKKDYNSLLKLCYKLAHGIIKKRKWKVSDDVIQDALIQTYRTAIPNYEPSKGSLFSFLTKSIQNNLKWKAIREQEFLDKHYGISLEELEEQRLRNESD